MRRPLMLALLALPLPALAQTGDYGFFSLRNTDFVVLIAFLVFVGILIYFRVPQRVAGLLDQRAGRIRGEIDEARALREEAQSLLASYERRSREMHERAERIVERAREEAREAGEQARRDLDAQVSRRIQGAEEQIAQAEAAAIQQIRDRAARIAVAAASEVIAERMDPERQGALVDRAIATLEAKLH